jgi:hypothetical protein
MVSTGWPSRVTSGRSVDRVPSQSIPERLREGLLELAESQGDTQSLTALTGVAGLAAEKDGDIRTAVELSRRAVAAGSTDGKVADRFSIWLVE